MLQVLKTKKKSDKKHSKTVIYCLAALKGFIFFLLCTLLVSLLILKSESDSAFYYIASYIFLSLGGFISGISAYKKLKGRGFQNGIIAASVYWGYMFIVVTAFMRFNVNAHILITFPISAVSGLVGGIIGANT